jgi:hypothetical protein
MNETELMDRFYSKGDLRHVEASDILGEDFVLNEHGHQVTTRQELHQHVQEGAVLKGRVKLDDPRTVRLGQNVTFGTDVSQLVFFELFPSKHMSLP